VTRIGTRQRVHIPSVSSAVMTERERQPSRGAPSRILRIYTTLRGHNQNSGIDFLPVRKMKLSQVLERKYGNSAELPVPIYLDERPFCYRQLSSAMTQSSLINGRRNGAFLLSRLKNCETSKLWTLLGLIIRSACRATPDTVYRSRRAGLMK
jgi:hypothetical protein